MTDRPEQAFRDALARHADDLDPVPLEQPRRRRVHGWIPVAAAAAAVALVVGVTWVGVGGDGATTPAADETTSEPVPTEDVTNAPLPLRSVSFHDVEVEVPATWTDAYPSLPWCLVDSAPAAGPYVEQHATNMAVPSIACGDSPVGEPGFPAYRQQLWRPHLVLAPASPEGPADGTYGYRGWTSTVRTVDQVTLTLLTNEATTPLAEGIVDSAMVVETDAAGCDVTSPIQRPGFQSPTGGELSPDAQLGYVAICQYEVGVPGTPGLVGSRRLDGDEALGLREAILAGAEGSGPNNPTQCSPEFDFGTAIVLRFGVGEAIGPDVYAYYETCVGNGFFDGTEARALTTDSCPPLFGGRVVQHGGNGTPGEVCHGYS